MRLFFPIFFLVSIATLTASAQAADSPTAMLLAAAENQSELVGANLNGTIIVDFSASWCTPCKINEPHVRSFAATYGWTFVLMDTDLPATRPFMTAFGIDSMPTYVVFSGGALVEKFGFGVYYNRETPTQAQARIYARLKKTASLITH